MSGLSLVAASDAPALSVFGNNFNCHVGMHFAKEPGSSPTTGPIPLPVCAEDTAVDRSNFIPPDPFVYMSGRTGAGDTEAWEATLEEGTCFDSPGSEKQLVPSFAKESYGVKTTLGSHFENWWNDQPYEGVVFDERQSAFFESPFEAPYATRIVKQILALEGYTCDDLTEPLGFYELVTHPVWDVLADVPLKAVPKAEDMPQLYPEGGYVRTPINAPLLEDSGKPVLVDARYKDAYQRVRVDSKAEFCAMKVKDINFSMLIPQVGGTFRYLDADLEVPASLVMNLRGSGYDGGLSVHHIFCESCEAEGVGTCTDTYDMFNSGEKSYSLAIRYWHQAVSFGSASYSPCLYPPPPREILPEEREFCGEDDPNYDQHFVAGVNNLYPVEELYQRVMIGQYGLPDEESTKLFFCAAPHDFYLANNIATTPYQYRIYHHFCDFCGGLELAICDGYAGAVDLPDYRGCLSFETFQNLPDMTYFNKTAPTCDAIEADINAVLEPLYPLPNCDRMPYACQDLSEVCADPNLEERASFEARFGASPVGDSPQQKFIASITEG